MRRTKRKIIRDEYESWFSSFHWRWFATLKLIKGHPSRKACLSVFDRWITELKDNEGSSRFRWVRVLERGAYGDNFHLHVLVGGFRNRMADWGRRWERLGGEALIKRFDPDQGAIPYILKSIDREGDLDVDYELPGLDDEDWNTRNRN